jgi:hypothetical protein
MSFLGGILGFGGSSSNSTNNENGPSSSNKSAESSISGAETVNLKLF